MLGQNIVSRQFLAYGDGMARLLTAGEAADIAGYSYRQFMRIADRGHIEPAEIVTHGNSERRLFTRDAAERLRQERLDKLAELEDRLLRVAAS